MDVYLEECYQFWITSTCKCPIHFCFVKSFRVPKSLFHCEIWYLHNKNYCEPNKLCTKIIATHSYWFRPQWCMNGLILRVVKTLKKVLFYYYFLNSHVVWKAISRQFEHISPNSIFFFYMILNLTFLFQVSYFS